MGTHSSPILRSIHWTLIWNCNCFRYLWEIVGNTAALNYLHVPYTSQKRKKYILNKLHTCDILPYYGEYMNNCLQNWILIFFLGNIQISSRIILIENRFMYQTWDTSKTTKPWASLESFDWDACLKMNFAQNKFSQLSQKFKIDRWI